MLHSGSMRFEDGKPHWRKQRFADYVKRHRMSWPAYPDGSLDERDATFREMEGRYPRIGPLRELRYSISKLRLNALSVGGDGRNRTLLGAYGSKTGRNQPSNAKYVFGPAKWIRFLITPPPGRVLIHRDFCQQEIRIAAVVSGDAAMLAACESATSISESQSSSGSRRRMQHRKRTNRCARCSRLSCLGILYGLGARTLALRIGISLFEACEILARLRAQFRVFEIYAQRVVDHAGLQLEISTPFDWTMQCPPGINLRTCRNFRSNRPQPKSCTSPAYSPNAAGSRSSGRYTMPLWPKPISIAWKR